MDDKKVWVPHSSDGFKLGRIVDIAAEGAVVEVLTIPGKGQRITSPMERIYPADEYEDKDVDDNCSLMYLNEATLLNNIRIRYMKNSIYTYVANILVAVNPYFDLPQLYSSSTIQSYLGKSMGTMPPHVFAIADKAYRDMKLAKLSQSIIVSGESGAGKTESTKYILKYVTECWGNKVGSIEKRIVESNPLLEAFGNAKTMRNNNSSRFGKFVEIHFDAKYQVCGGYISHYLLEKSRICTQNDQERNYHIFYRICAGAPENLKQQLKLAAPDAYNYLNKGCTQYFCNKQSIQQLGSNRKSQMFMDKGGLTDIQLDDVRDFKLTDAALDHMGMNAEEKLSIYQIISAVLHLGNILFEDDPASKGGCKVVSRTEASLQTASVFLGCEPSDLQRSLVSRAMQTAKGGKAGTVILVHLKPSEAQNARDALAKSIYSKLFDYIVSRINQSLPFQSSKSFIGILDIAGFEYFQTNSFEQFCINYCNEKLQQFFNNRILKEEQVLYEKEGLKVKKIDYVDNQDCIDLIERKGTGIFDILDEENKLPKASYDHFTMEVHNKNKNHYRLNVPRKSALKAHREVRDEEGFLIRHYAGAVCYQTAQFVEKNNDALHASLSVLVIESRNPFVKGLFSASAAGMENEKVGKLNFISIGSKFRSQLETLMQKLYSTGTSFIRCIKPNIRMVDHCFEGTQILTQLQCSGMTSVLELMQQGYPSRTQFQDLYNMYKLCMPPKIARLDPRMFCKALFKALGLSDTDFKFGLTKVFFRPGKFAEFDKIMKSDPANLANLIALVNKWLVCARFRKAQWCALSVIKLKNKIIYRKGLLVRLQGAIKTWNCQKEFKPRIKTFGKMQNLIKQLGQMKEMASGLKTEKDSAAKRIGFIEKEVQDGVVKLRSLGTKINKDDCNRMYENIVKNFDLTCADLKKMADKEKLEQEKMKKIQEEMEREKKRKDVEEKLQRMPGDDKKKKAEIEAKRKKEEELFKKLENQYDKNPDALRKLEDDLNQKKHELDQERLDRELALRIASEDSNQVDDVPSFARSTSIQKMSGVKPKYDFSKFTYAQLRDTINTSCDMELINACKEEFHRRLKVYHDWKTKNSKVAGGGNDNFPANVSSFSPNPSPSKSSSGLAQEMQRYFRIVFRKSVEPTTDNRTADFGSGGPGSGGTKQKRGVGDATQTSGDTAVAAQTKGWWYAHFDGKWIARQMEVHEGKKPLLLLAGLDDMKMCELSLDETGLTRKRGAEILEGEFDEEWNKNGGLQYMKANVRNLSSKLLKMKLGVK